MKDQVAGLAAKEIKVAMAWEGNTDDEIKQVCPAVLLVRLAGHPLLMSISLRRS